MTSKVKQRLLANQGLVRRYEDVRELMELAPMRARYRRAKTSIRPDAQAAIETLQAEGLCVLDAVLDPMAVAEMARVVDDAIAAGRYQVGGRVASEAPPAEVPARMNVVDATLLSPAFVQGALDPLLLEIADAHLGVETFISGIVAYRTQPVDRVPDGAFRWHYDQTPRQLKAICYLTDVETDEDGPLQFVRGTHGRRKPGTGYEETRVPETDLPESGRTSCIGAAGTMLIVDTNGIHRATPNVRSHRDVVTFIYDTGTRGRAQSFYNLPVPSPEVWRMSPDQRRRLRLPPHGA